MANRKTWDRYSFESLEKGCSDPLGRLFVSPLGQEDLARVQVLASSVDTVRQLYNGIPNPDALLVVQTAYDAGFKNMVELGGYRWVVGAGGKSGYRFRLQNNDLGLIVFVGSHYGALDKEGAHLKIECSPHWIAAREPAQITADMQAVACTVLDHAQASSVAVHVAIDVQGWEPPKDFQDRLVARSKRQARWASMDTCVFDLNEIAATYGDNESYLFGGAGSLQFAAYRKDREARKSDKWHYFRNLWEGHADRKPDSFESVFDPDAPVWRLEFRFHHSVVSQFADGVGESWRTFADVAPHLTGLLRYGLDSYRLDRTRTYIDPFWQLLLEDVRVYGPSPSLTYKRARKEPGRGNERNVAIAMGNLFSIYARNGFSDAQALGYLRKSGMWNDVLNYLFDRQIDISEFEQRVSRELALRRMVGKAA